MTGGASGVALAPNQGKGCADFEAHLPLIDDVTSYVCRRQSLRFEEAEDFASSVKVFLLEDDCAVLNRFLGKSRLSTYLTTVVLNLARDERMRRWRRWRPSAVAQRLGTVAVQLETLTVRDGRLFREAVEIMQRHHGVKSSPAELAAMAGQFPSRPPRRFTTDESLVDLANSDDAAARVRDGESAATLGRAGKALEEVLATLAVEDRLILKMRFKDGLKISAIAGALGLAARPLYRRLEKLRGRLRSELEQRGLAADDVLGSLGSPGTELEIDYDLAPRVQPWNRPSNRTEEE